MGPGPHELCWLAQNETIEALLKWRMQYTNKYSHFPVGFLPVTYYIDQVVKRDEIFVPM